MENVEKVGRILRRSLIKDVKAAVESKNNAFILSYSALSASQMNDLRKDLKRAGAKIYISKID